MPDPRPKNIPYRSDKWLAAVRSLHYCVLCGAYGVQAAHQNEGKGKGMKQDDWFDPAADFSADKPSNAGNERTPLAGGPLD